MSSEIITPRYAITILTIAQVSFDDMANLGHRLTRNEYYSLRGHVPVPYVSPTTATQRRKEAASKHVNRNWPITRISRRSRCLQREGNTCVRLSGLQDLLDLPRFVHWIVSLNSIARDGTIRFPCRDLTHTAFDLAASMESEEKPMLTRCPACVMKQFAHNYWDGADMGAAGNPVFWAHEHINMAAVRNLDRQLFAVTPGAAADSQQDPREFQDRILRACVASTDYM